MSVSVALCTSFLSELLQAVHVFDSDTFRLALFAAPVGTFGAATTNYSNLGTYETTSSNYTTGGNTLSGAQLATTSGSELGRSGEAYFGFSATTFSSVTMSPSGALLYNATKSNRAVAVYSFDPPPVFTSATFQIVPPAFAPSTAEFQL